MQFAFAHESLDVYRLALDVARFVATSRFGPGMADLRDQAVRASRPVVLDIAEGRARGGDAGRIHLRIALGSAAEVCAVLDLAVLPGGEAQQVALRRVGPCWRAWRADGPGPGPGTMHRERHPPRRAGIREDDLRSRICRGCPVLRLLARLKSPDPPTRQLGLFEARA